MSNDITDLVQSAITGGARGFLGEFAVRGIDEARFIQMFVEAGEMVAGYEYYKTEENDFRARIFDKENMVALAKMMRSIDDFSWMDALEKELDHKLEVLRRTTVRIASGILWKSLRPRLCVIGRTSMDMFCWQIRIQRCLDCGERFKHSRWRCSGCSMTDRGSRRITCMQDRSKATIGNPILSGKRIKRNPDFIYRDGI